MRTLLASVAFLSLCASLTGCETSDCKTDDGEDAKCAESLEAFESDPEIVDEVYTPGASLTIQGLYGDISVEAGEEGVVRTKFQPFNYRGHEHEDEALQEIADHLQLDVSADADGNLTITTDRDASKTGGLGSHITVSLPPEFSGTLIVQNEGKGFLNQGNISVGYVADATTLNVVNNGLENCNILRGEDDRRTQASGLTDVDVRCEAGITVLGVNDNVFVHSRNSTFNNDVRVELLSVSETATGGEVIADNGSVELRLPSGADFEVSGSATGPGAHVNDVNVPTSCDATADDASVEVICGAGGPVYTLNAVDGDPDDDEKVFVNVIVD